MGFLDFLKGIGGGILSGVQKAAGLVGKIAPMVSQVAGMIPTPFSQGIASMANLVGGVANAVAPGQQPSQPGVGPVTAMANGASPGQVAAGAGQPTLGAGGGGVPVQQGPVM
jgi:hypothetical protein